MLKSTMLDTTYAKELCEPGVKEWPLSREEARIERLRIKATNVEEIRFSWWKNGKIVPRPLDLTEADLIELIQSAVEKNVLSPKFLSDLRALLGAE